MARSEPPTCVPCNGSTYSACSVPPTKSRSCAACAAVRAPGASGIPLDTSTLPQPVVSRVTVTSMPPGSAGCDGGVYPGLQTSVLGGDETVTDEVPDFPSTSAVIVAAPALTAVTSPAVDTVATYALDVDQLGVRSGRAFPFASLATAVSVVVPPMA